MIRKKRVIKVVKQVEKPSDLSINISKKKEILEQARAVLKTEFVGINSVIDEVIHSVEPWFIFPEGQLRPTVINCFGLTGGGKTSMVTRLSELLNFGDKLFKFDIGEYSSGDMKLKRDFSDNLKDREKQPIILLFDEFQLGRTINENGSEIDRNGLRGLWDLLDNGQISIIEESYHLENLISLYLKLEYCTKNGVESKNGKITKSKKFHTDLFFSQKKVGRRMLSQNDNGDKVDNDLFVPADNIYTVKEMSKVTNFESIASIKNKLSKMTHTQTLAYIKEIVDYSLKPVIHDFSQSLIFVVGNLDEVYAMADVIDPDYDADIFHKHSLKITVPKVKEALKDRFRVEQIARLGNNHILYPAFSSESYRNLISMELEKFKKRAKLRYEVDIEFDNTVNDIIYREGVFPTQGTRPIFTTINVLIESYISKIMSDLIIEKITPVKIEWNFNNETSEYKITTHYLSGKETKTFSKTYSLNLKLDNLRKSTKDDKQAHTALHEAGHAVISCVLLNLIPEEIVSKTAGARSEGYCRINMPDIMTSDLIKKDIIVGLGGYAAERLIFGNELLSTGSSGDITMATEKAISYIKSYGMNGLPLLVGVPSDKMNDTHYFEDNVSNKEVKKLIEESLKSAEKILKKEKKLLLKMAEYLSENTRMKPEMTLEYVKEYCSDKNIKTKNSDSYHDFKNILSSEINKLR